MANRDALKILCMTKLAKTKNVMATYVGGCEITLYVQISHLPTVVLQQDVLICSMFLLKITFATDPPCPLPCYVCLFSYYVHLFDMAALKMLLFLCIITEICYLNNLSD